MLAYGDVTVREARRLKEGTGSLAYYGVTFPLLSSGWTTQAGAATANGAAGTNADPFDVQITCWPVITFDQRMLLTPFPVTSGVARICQSREMAPGNH